VRHYFCIALANCADPAGSLLLCAGAGRLQNRVRACPQGQERHAKHAPLTGRELRELRRHQRESAKSPFVFVSERGSPLSAAGFSRMIERAAVVHFGYEREREAIAAVEHVRQAIIKAKLIVPAGRLSP
jgi:hypothetical protein